MGKPEVERVCQLGYLSALRGTDSTGIAFGFRKKKERGKFGVYTHKMVVPSPAYLSDKHTQTVLDSQFFFMMGHCRASTIGATDLDNAHPHEVEHITGTHNGTIPKWGNNKKSDSRILFERLAADGVAKAFGEADDGAYATVFADRRARTLNFFRNDKRPLYLCWNKAEKSLLWASEKEMIELVAERTNFNAGEVWMLKPHTLYSIPFGEVKEKIDAIDLIKPVVMSRATFLPQRVWPSHDPAFKSEDDDVGSLIERGLASRIKYEHEHKAGLHTFPKDKHYDSEYYKCLPTKYIITREDADLALEVGCNACGAMTEVDDTSIKWLDDTTHLCKDCQGPFHQIFVPGFGDKVSCG
jgi:hypothetical protein